jgi:hypothetical protein
VYFSKFYGESDVRNIYFLYLLSPIPKQPAMKKILLLSFTAFSFFISHSQDKVPVKFGKVSAEDFSPKVYSIDSNAAAVVIADVGSSEIIGNSKGWFSLQFKRYKRIRILDKSAFDEANVEVWLVKDGDREEQLSGVKAVTYNLENGKVVETTLDKGSIFKDRLDKSTVVKKFTLPNVKEGSIIEYQYTVESDFLFNLQPWEFQGEIPVLWSEYNLTLPEFFGYLFLTQGYMAYDINERKNNQAKFSIRNTQTAEATETFNFDAQVTNYRWVIKNVPSLKPESFTSTYRNHIAKIEFQLSDYRYPLTPRTIMGTWPAVADELLHAEYFGSSLDKNNNWLGNVIDPLIKETHEKLEIAKKIYAYVRDNYTCVSHNGRDLDQPLKNVLKTRNGSVAEINLLLTAMLKYADIQADPVILSTREHGYTYSLYPVLTKFNYVICDVNIGGKSFFLDASYPKLGFGRLPADCYNGHARIVDKAATPLEFSADSIFEKKITSIMMNIDEKGNMEGRLQQMPGYYESHDIRETIKEKGRDEFFKEAKKAYGQDAEFTEEAIDSLNNLEENVAIHYDFKLKQDKEDVIYLNPMWGEGYKENPFKSAERFYPVEMPYAMDETYLFTMIIPDGYIVDELPKSIIVKLNEEGDGQFEYRISESAGMINLRSRITLKRAYYLPEEYELLREFFNLIVKKHNEQIVLKKKK